MNKEIGHMYLRTYQNSKMEKEIVYTVTENDVKNIQQK